MYVSLRLRAMLVPVIVLAVILVAGTVSSNFGRVEKAGSEEAVLTEGKIQADCYKVLIKTYLTDIQSIIYDYYDSFIDIRPTVDYDSVSVERVYSDKTKDFIVFNCKPFVEAHNTIGIEEILFSADKQGNVKLVQFTHIKGFQLPEHLQNHIKNEYPMQAE